MGKNMMRSPQGGLSAGKGSLKVVTGPVMEVDILVLPPPLARAVRLAHGEGHCQSREQRQSTGSVGTTYQGKLYG